ncbi:MAG: hypothetical protein AAF990_24245 [Bacteroidota bacterium]
MYLRYLLSFLLIGTLLTSAKAQSLDAFSENQTEFLDQLEKLMTASKRTVLEEVFKDFESQFKGGLFTDEQFSQILLTSNAMLKQKMKASPYFSNYLKCLVAVRNTEQEAENFKSLHNVLDQMLANIENRKLKPYTDYLTFATNFFETKSLRYSKNGATWIAQSETFVLDYKDKVPLVTFEKLNLKGTRKKDSIIILETSGTYFPILNQWQGKGGKVTWERFGLTDVYCVLGEYKIDTKKTLYDVEEVELFYPELFPGKPIKGSFKDKITIANARKEVSYPRFESYERILEIDNIGEGVDYIGGFRLNGTTVYGFGDKDNPARINISNNSGRRIFRGISQLFVIRKGERLAGERVESTIYFAQDSIYHPSVNIKFEIQDKSISLYRGKRGSDRNPFYNSFMKMNINTDNVNWFMEKDSLVIGKQLASISRKREAEFESLDYFSEGDYRRLQNISSANPIALLKVVAEKEGTNFLDAHYVAERLNPRYDITIIQPLLYDLVARGFINYNKDEEEIEVKEKVFHYANASQKKEDYDYLKIISKSDSVNAVMSIAQKMIYANGINSVEFSPKQRVALKPLKGQVTFKKDRDMDFDGRLFAGLSIFQGKDFRYNYIKHKIEMDSVRYFDLFIPTEAKDQQGNPVALSMASRIEKLSGTLLIDAPHNKSGQEDIASFPSFNSKGASYVFYGNKDIQGGAYKRDSFYFQLNEFNFNDLDNFPKEAISFDGEMVSAEIFPVFKETLVLREEDQSLGFVSRTPTEGYPTYQEKGTYRGEIDLSNEGFLGKGDINYLRATFKSEDIVFKPKQLTATADRFDLEEDRVGPPEVPNALGVDVSIDWRPYKDSMYVRTKEKPFELFNSGNHNLKGVLILTPNGLKANGVFQWDKGRLDSELMSFGAFSVDADTSNLQIFAFGSEDLAFDTRNVKTFLDFDKQEGRIKANSSELSTTMPYNEYQTSMNEFIWNMKEEHITFLTEEGKYGSFRSIHPDQDSLTFQGKSAFYDLTTNLLQIGGVPVINTCDAYIYTKDGNVEIQKGAVMTTLDSVRIVADTANKYHVINRATVNIYGKKHYKAKGYYEYNIGDKKQEIVFNDIIGTRVGKGKRSEKKTVTRATGEAKPEDKFYIDHKTEFRGKIQLNAENKKLDFDGFARMDAPMLPAREWFSVKFKGDKKDLAITFDQPKNYRSDPLRNGLFLSKATAKMYPRIMQPLNLRKDRPILETKGLFKYNKVRDEFILGDSLKIVDNVRQGNQMTFSNKTGKINLEGKFNIGSGLNYVSITAAGAAKTAYSDTTSTNLDDAKFDVLADMMAGVELIIPDKLMKIMMTDIKSSSFDAKVIDYTKNQQFYEKALSELIPSVKDYNKTVEGMINLGLDLPSKHDPYTIFFSNLPMKWDPEYQSFVSAKTKVGVGSINGEPVNRWLTSYVEFKMPSNEDDRLYVYIKSPSDYYYFFGYKQGVLNVVSNNTVFNEAVESLKKKEKVRKMKDGEFYEIALVEPGSAQMFLNRIRAAQKR